MTQNRGQLTDRIKSTSKTLFGYELSVRQLRLIPYVIYTVSNEKIIDQKRINDEEREIIKQWVDENHIYYNGDGTINVTKHFWDISNEIIYLGYVDLIKENGKEQR